MPPSRNGLNMGEALTRYKRIIDLEAQLVSVIGNGAFGRVFLARPIRRLLRMSKFDYPDTFVIKIIHREHCTASVVNFIHCEIETIQKLHHPNIIRYIGSWMEAGKGKFLGCYCIAMDYCGGGDMKTLVKDYKARNEFVPRDLAVRLMLHVFSALNFIHSNRIIHRDIKPDNVFLATGRNGIIEGAVVGDYGLARPLKESMQMVATRVGTPYYFSPEIAAGEPYSCHTDIFSAGVMFFEVLAKEKPFGVNCRTERDTHREILYKNPLPRFRELCGDYYHGIEDILVGCLRKHEAHRLSAYDILTNFCSRLTSEMPMTPIRTTPVIAKGFCGGLTVEEVNAELTRKERPQPADGSLDMLADVVRQSFSASTDDELLQALNNDLECFLLLKVLQVSRRGYPSLERATQVVLQHLQPRHRKTYSFAYTLLQRPFSDE